MGIVAHAERVFPACRFTHGRQQATIATDLRERELLPEERLEFVCVSSLQCSYHLPGMPTVKPIL